MKKARALSHKEIKQHNNGAYDSGSGFTIVELLVVIVVIGILAAITIISYSGIRQRANLATLQSDLKNASTQLEIDKTNNDKYPSSKEESNNNAGLRASSNNVFSYNYSSANDAYCLTATNSTLSYFINSMTKAPYLGMCPDYTFLKTWGGSSDDSGDTVVKTSDGGYAIAGENSSYSAGDYDAFLTKFSSNGTLSWSKSFGNASTDFGWALAQTNDSGFIFSGAYASGNNTAFVIKLDQTGGLSWKKAWGGSSWDFPYSIIQASDGSYVMSGSSYSFGTNGEAFIAKISSDGTSISWDKTWGGSGFDDSGSIVQTNDGGYLITGVTSSFGNAEQVYIAKYSSGGTLLWDKTWGGAGDDSARTVIQANDGGYVVVGQTNSFGSGEEMFLAKFASDGTLSWDKVLGGTGDERGCSLVQTSDGGYVVVGDTNSFGSGGKDALIAKFSSDGDLLWGKTWGGGTDDGAYSVALTNEGGYVVTGSTTYVSGSTVGDAFIARFGADGSIAGCPSTICENISLTVSDPSASVGDPSATDSNPTATLATPTPNLIDRTANSTTIVSP